MRYDQVRMVVPLLCNGLISTCVFSYCRDLETKLHKLEGERDSVKHQHKQTSEELNAVIQAGNIMKDELAKKASTEQLQTTSTQQGASVQDYRALTDAGNQLKQQLLEMIRHAIFMF